MGDLLAAWSSPWAAWGRSGGCRIGGWRSPAGEVATEGLVDWNDTDMPESREPILPRRPASVPAPPALLTPPSVDHITTFTTTTHCVLCKSSCVSFGC